jgi:WD40 repeat protein
MLLSSSSLLVMLATAADLVVTHPGTNPGEIRCFRTHKGLVEGVAISPEGKLAVTGCAAADDADGKYLEFHVRLWDLDNPRPPRLLKGHAGAVRSVTFSPDGKRVASGATDGTVRLWDLATGKEVRQWNVSKDRPAAPAAHAGQIWSVAFSPDGKRVVAGGGDHVVRLWDVATGKLLRRFEGHTWGVSHVAFSPDGNHILSAGSYDRTVRLWDAEGGKSLQCLEGFDAGVMTAVFSPDGKQALTSTGGSGENMGGTVQLWDLATGKEVRRFAGHQMWTHSVAFSPDGKRVVSASSDKTMRVWDAQTGKELRQFTGHTGAIQRVVISPDGRRALTGSYDHTMRLWALPE